ncbi:putative major facilitator superfamily protein [Flexivirga endophytica]|uniref:Major facilitator superfamily protein n=1 Tax=Flexivirga endophytica TaxID=1849103 RepID=A0A916SUM4_9MICO|nr:MFS transporter [Flexivirga endophytica]GGB17055.1 putative major facilitator superfamily protein [Flexivirga endophytica]GHB38513.1 putative major facilitator superfamily protein [Flexivirga endophytica]
MTEASTPDQGTQRTRGPRRRFEADHPRYKWVALSNTTLGVLMATINSSIVIISLPAIFRGIDLDPLGAGNISYLLWTLMGYLVVSAVLVVTLGRLGDMFGRVKIYNLGFVVFTVASILLSLDPADGGTGAMWIIIWRIVQGVGGAMLMANSTAILTDAFPATQRGMALGINQVSAIAGSFLGLIIGGVLSEWHWRAIFWVSVPIGLLGTVWAYKSLHELGTKRGGRLDLPGNISFAVGVTAILVAITYGIQPYGGHTMGWTSPWVLAGLIGGTVVLIAFCIIETKVAEPMFAMRLFRIKAFSAGNFAGLLASIGRGGMQFMLIIWLQGIWLPLHGYRYESTPLWAGIFLVPLTIGFLIAGPVCGFLSDRFGARAFASGGLLITAATFVGFLLIPVNFDYWIFAVLLFVNGVGSGMFSAPNTTAIMNSVPANERGAASGMRATFFNSGTSLSIGIFFSLMIAGLAQNLPDAMRSGLISQQVPTGVAGQVAGLPPVGSMFAAFLGYNPIESLLGPTGTLDKIPASNASTLTGKEFFPHLLSGPFHDGLVVVFTAAAAMMVVAAVASVMRGSKYIHDDLAEQASEDSGSSADVAVTR